MEKAVQKDTNEQPKITSQQSSINCCKMLSRLWLSIATKTGLGYGEPEFYKDNPAAAYVREQHLRY